MRAGPRVLVDLASMRQGPGGTAVVVTVVELVVLDDVGGTDDVDVEVEVDVDPLELRVVLVVALELPPSVTSRWVPRTCVEPCVARTVLGWSGTACSNSRHPLSSRRKRMALR